MKLLTTILFSFLLFACNGTKMKKKEKNALCLNHAEQNIVAHKGQQLYYEMDEHSSVGFQARASIGDSSVLALESTEFVYDNPPKGGVVAAGGDSGQRIFYIRCMKTGQTNLEFTQYFRGDKEASEPFSVNVVE